MDAIAEFYAGTGDSEVVCVKFNDLCKVSEVVCVIKVLF